MRTAHLGLANLVLAFVVLGVSTPVLAQDKYDEAIANFKKSETSKNFFDTAYGYVVFPNIGKGGIGIGGAAGTGRVYEKGKVIGESKMTQVSVGLQMGGQAYSQVIFFQDKVALDSFTRGEFEFGADASAVAITLGANASAGSTGASASASVSEEKGKTASADYYKGMAIFTLAKGGLMYQAAIAGQKYKFTPKTN